MDVKLKPCPFCGGEATLYNYEESRDIYDKETLGYVDTEYFTKYGVDCEFCGCIVADRNSKTEAIEAWNTRKPMELIMDDLEDLRWEHPYKQIGEPDTYSQYNEAWQDCLDRVERFLEGFERQLKGGSNE